MDGSRHTVSTSRARGRHVLPWLRRNRTNRLKVLLAPAILGAAIWVSPAFSTTHTVCASGCAFTSIQAAITAASPGDTINVGAGTYNERNIVIDKSLTLTGDPGDAAPGPGANAPIIDGDGGTSSNAYDDGFKIANGVTNVTISGFIIQNLKSTPNDNDGTGVGVQGYVHSTSNITVSDNHFRSLGYGVLAGNEGAQLGTHTNWSVTNNIFEGFLIGAELSNTSSSQVSNNIFHMTDHMIGATQHYRGVAIFTYVRRTQSNLTFSGNTIDGSLAPLTFQQPMFPSGGYPAILVWPRNGDEDANLSNLTISNNDLSGLTGTAPRIFMLNSKAYTGRGGSLGSKILSATLTNNRFGAAAKSIATDPSGYTVNSQAVAVAATLDASQNFWGQAGGPTSGQAVGNLTTAPWIAAYTPDPTKSGSPGFWPTSVTTNAPCTTVCYVAKSGNDSNTGSAAYPFLTIQKGLDSVASGGTVNVAAGVYAESPTVSGKPVALKGAKSGIAAGPLAAPVGRDVNATGGFSGETEIQGTLAVSGASTAGTVLDGLVVNTESYSILLWQGATATTVRNCVLTGRPFDSGRALEKQSTSSTSTANPYVIQNNWISGGEYLMNFNEDRDLTTYLIDGNYITGGIRGIQTFGSSTGTYTITNNLIEGVTVGIRLSRDGAIIRGNTIRNLTGVSTTQAAVRVDINVTAVNTEASSIPQSRGITITNNVISGSVYGVSLEKPMSGVTYTVTGNRFGGQSGNSLRTVTSQAGAVITATANYWGQDSGPSGGQVSPDANATINTGSYLTSSASAALFPGFWPVASPAVEVTAPLTTTIDAPPVAAAVDLGGGSSTSLVLDFGEITTSGDVTVTRSSTPTDGSVSFGGNAVLKIDFTGEFTPPVKVCLSYDDSMFPEGSTPALWHYEETSPGSGVYAWEPLTTVSLDTVNKVICALTYSFSDFAPGIAATDACDNTGGTLTVTIPDGLDVTVARNPSNTLTVTFDVGTECSASPATIGSNSGAGQIRTLALVGGSGNETVTFATATPTNWGANSTSSLARTIDLGAGSGDLVILQGTSSGETITASAIASAFTNVESLQLEGLGGTDTLTAGSTPDVLYGGAGNDILKGGDGNDTFFGGDDNDSLQGGAGFDCADYSSETDALTIDLTSGSGTGGTAVDTDTYMSMECVKGGSGNDTLKGSAYGDTFYGNGGNDTLQGRGGPDTLNGGAGTGDTVTYAEQTYAVVVNLTAQTATGTTVGTDTIVAGTVENVIGGSAGDTLVGDAYANTLTGGAGNDTLVGMGGNDSFTGGTGIDTVSYDDVMWPGAAVSGITVSLASSSGQTTGGAGEDTLVDTFENVTGSSYIDGLTGNSLVNIINGLGGVDTVNAGGGNDTVNGGAGGDTLNGEAGADTIRGGDDDDTINGGADADAIWGDAGGDTLLGGAAGDTLRGGAGNDILVGGSGTGVDVMYGDADTDTISYDSDVYTAGAYGNAASTGYIVFKLSSVGIQQATNGAGTDVAGDLIENLTGTSGNDTLIGNSLANVIYGLGGADVLQGGDGNDFLYAGEGTGNKAEGQAGTDTCTVSGAGTWVYLWPKTCEP